MAETACIGPVGGGGGGADLTCQLPPRHSCKLMEVVRSYPGKWVAQKPHFLAAWKYSRDPLLGLPAEY